MEFQNWTSPKIGPDVDATRGNRKPDICDKNPNICGMEAGCYDTGNGYICLCHDLQPAGPNNDCERSKEASFLSSTVSSIKLKHKDPTEGAFGSHQLLGMLSPSTAQPINVSDVNVTHPEIKNSSPHSSTSYRISYTIVLSCMLTIGIIFALCLVVFIYKKKLGLSWFYQKRARDAAALSLSKCMQQYVTNPNYYTNASESPLLRSLQDLEIPQENIEVLDEIGEGCFGNVYKGLLKTNSIDTIPIAIKTLKDNISPDAMNDFEREVHIMAAFRHENILRLLGVVIVENFAPQMIFEYMEYGDLAQLLRNNNPEIRLGPSPESFLSLTPADLIMVSYQIARGMRYLSEQHFVHRDLATRNCLVGENLSVKISDFGMSRDIYTSDYYKAGGSRMLPVRWMAPESITYGRFSLESDAWSYGVVLWEIFTYAKQPYYGHCNEEVINLILQGILLQPPLNCPSFITTIMAGCWKTDPLDRMTFEDIYIELCPYILGGQLATTTNFADDTTVQIELEDSSIEMEVTPV